MTGAQFDFSEANVFAVEIEEAAAEVGRNMVKAVKTAAFRGRQEWIKAARSHAGNHLPGYPTSIDFDDIEVGGGVIFTELGPNLDRNQGPLGIVEEAPGGVRGTPQRNYLRAEQVIAEDLVKGTLIAIGDGMGEP